MVPAGPQVPPASTSVPAGPNEIVVTRTAPPHPLAAEEAAMAPGPAIVDQVAPALALASMAPLLSSATSLPPKADSAPGEAATAASIGPPVDQEAPPFAVSASGEYLRFWVGRTATVREFAPSAEATSPPLLATPGGVTSFHVPEFAARANTCQNVGSADIGTTAQLPADVASEVAIELAPDVTAPAPDADADEDAEDPHAATAPVATSATQPQAAKRPGLPGTP